MIFKSAFFYESRSFISVFIYSSAAVSAAHISSYTSANTTITNSTTASLLLLQIMLLGICPIIIFYTKVKLDLVHNRDILLFCFVIRPNHCDSQVLTLIINIV